MSVCDQCTFEDHDWWVDMDEEEGVGIYVLLSGNLCLVVGGVVITVTETPRICFGVGSNRYSTRNRVT